MPSATPTSPESHPIDPSGESIIQKSLDVTPTVFAESTGGDGDGKGKLRSLEEDYEIELTVKVIEEREFQKVRLVSWESP